MEGIIMINKIFLTNITCEGLKNPLGIDCFNPRFSYEIVSNMNNVYQESYQIVVVKNNEIVWDSGVVASSQSQNIVYQGEKLIPCQEYQFEISVVCNGETANGKGKFETGLLNTKFKGEFIGLTNPDLRPSNSPKPITFKNNINVKKEN